MIQAAVLGCPELSCSGDGGQVDAGPPVGSCDDVCFGHPGYLLKTCNACTLAVCSTDPYCCSTQWDSFCSDYVASICVGNAGFPDGGPVCTCKTVSANCTGNQDCCSGACNLGRCDP